MWTELRWAELHALVPEELARYMPEQRWDGALLRALDLPVEPMPVADLAWQLACRSGGAATASSP